MSVDAASALCCCDQVVTTCCSLTSITMEITEATASFSCTIGQGENPSGTTGIYTSAPFSINPFYMAPRVLTRTTAQAATASLCKYVATYTYVSGQSPLISTGLQFRRCDAPQFTSQTTTFPTQTIRWFCEPYRYNINPGTGTIYGQIGWEFGLRFTVNVTVGSGLGAVTSTWPIVMARRTPLLTPCPLGLTWSIGNRNSYETRMRGLTRVAGIYTTQASVGDPQWNTLYQLWNGQEAASDLFEFALS